MPMSKEERAAYDKAHYEKHKERIVAKKKAHYEKHKERIAAQKKAYKQSLKGKKLRRINDWKRRGIISADYNSLYERYINTHWCENCEVALTEGRYSTPTTRCLDHDHSILDRENVRNILCHSCNIKRG